MRRWWLWLLIGLIVVALSIVNFMNQNNPFGYLVGQQKNNCPTLQSPVDTIAVTSVLYPGQSRGGNYKRHGGFRFDNAPSNAVNVRAPLDAKMVGASRYIEMGEVQYILDFKTDCGLRYRFDHILTLDQKFQAAINNLPEARENSSDTNMIRPAIAVTAGEMIATEIGFRQGFPDRPGPNVFVDFGVYLNNGGTCWFDLLPHEDAQRIRALPASDLNSGKQSDYCR